MSSSGISATCSGTICRAKTATKSASRPGNGIHAKAYAASEARNSGRSTAGMVMTMVLMKYWLRLAEVPGASASR